MPATRILVVDDEPLFGELLGGALAAAAEMEVVGIARDGETAVRLARQARPDAVLMDIQMPGRLDGIDAAVQIKRDRPRRASSCSPPTWTGATSPACRWRRAPAGPIS